MSNRWNSSPVKRWMPFHSPERPMIPIAPWRPATAEIMLDDLLPTRLAMIMPTLAEPFSVKSISKPWMWRTAINSVFLGVDSYVMKRDDCLWQKRWVRPDMEYAAIIKAGTSLPLNARQPGHGADFILPPLYPWFYGDMVLLDKAAYLPGCHGI